MDFIRETKERVCELLYQQNAVKINPEKFFILKGDIKSPLWFNLGVLENDFGTRSSIASALHIILTHNHDFDAVVGVVSGGVSWASNIANSRALPLIRVHSEPKKFGLFNQIEGEIPSDDAKVLIVDDAITSGINALKVVDALRRGENGKRAQVLGLCTIFDWDFPAVNEKFISVGVKKFSLVKFQEIIDYGFAHGYLSEDVRPAIDQFCAQYR
jgi:orotate phosphoribosyltransferase